MFKHVNSTIAISRERYFYYFKLFFDSKHTSGFRIGWSAKFLKYGMCRKTIFQVNQTLNNPPISAKIFLKREFVTFAVWITEFSNKNDCKLDKILRNFQNRLFRKILWALVIIEFAICALMRFFPSLFLDKLKASNK